MKTYNALLLKTGTYIQVNLQTRALCFSKIWSPGCLCPPASAISSFLLALPVCFLVQAGTEAAQGYFC